MPVEVADHSMVRVTVNALLEGAHNVMISGLATIS